MLASQIVYQRKAKMADVRQKGFSVIWAVFPLA